ncbi:hypothetical protein [Neobacillus muris]|nr:hypothetical protein [Neobacillus muris]
MAIDRKNQESDVVSSWTADHEQKPMTAENELLPEYDEIGTALNEL